MARDLLSRRPEADQARMRFEVGTAEDLSGIIKEDHSVDLVVACQYIPLYHLRQELTRFGETLCRYLG